MKSQDEIIFFPEDIRTKIITALKNCQDTNGNWCFPPQRQDNGFISVWTTAQVTWSLILSGTKPQYYEEALQLILNNDTYFLDNKLIGWVHENSNELGICVTCDCCITFILSDRYYLVKDVIDNLVSIQLTDNSGRIGWGYSISDTTSRVTPTCWAIRTLMYVAQDELLRTPEIIKSIKCGVNWLISVANMDEENYGWGVNEGANVNVSCTSWVILILLEVTQLDYLNIKFPFVKEYVKKGIETIEKLYTPQYRCWIGCSEGYKSFKMKGLGSSIVLIALTEAMDYGLIDVYDNYISYALEEVKSEKDGWIFPSYSQPHIYENVFWLLALSKFEHIYLKHSKEISERYLMLERKYKAMKTWLVRIVVWFLIAAASYTMYKVLKLYADNPLIPIVQSIVGAAIFEWPVKLLVGKIKAVCL